MNSDNMAMARRVMLTAARSLHAASSARFVVRVPFRALSATVQVSYLLTELSYKYSPCTELAAHPHGYCYFCSCATAYAAFMDRPSMRMYPILSSVTCPRLFHPQTFLEKAEVSERVMQVLKNFEKVEDAKVSPSAHFERDLSLDSLDAVEVCMALEEEFCIQIPDAEAESIKTVEDAVEFVSTHP